jgi:molybdate transport system substrate-binding protein
MAPTLPAPAREGPITGISSMATRRLLAELAAAHERQSGQPVVIESAGGVDVAKRIESGEPFDFVVLAAQALAALGDQGRVERTSCIDVARSRIALAVRAGTPPPDITSEVAVREAVLAARGIGYSTGPSGRHLAVVLERWGVAGTLAPRLVEAPPGIPVATLLARGDVDIGFQQLSELSGAAGITVVGVLPDSIQQVTVFAAGVCVGSARQTAARALLAFCASPEAAPAKRRHGMEP